MINTIYGNIIKSKTNKDISQFINSKPMFSVYNPENEAENFCKIETSNENIFFVTTGMAQAYHIFALIKHFPKSKIIIIERCITDFNLPEFSSYYETLKQNKNLIFSTIDTIETDLLNNYLPALDGDFIYKPLRSWLAHNNDIEKEINHKINNALKQIKDDYSVQAHFGKIWFVNFCKNLNIIKKHSQNAVFFTNLNFPKYKVAAIVAAGPTLDSTIEKIKQYREKYYVISTDTAYQSLIKNNIVPEAFVTIDAQQISALHVINDLNKNTLIICDLCCNSSILNKAVNQNCKILFSSNNNPFCNYAVNYLENIINENLFIKLDSGSGTVTMSALDFAYKAGFKNIEFFGCDFSYQNGKAYCKGTYLDRIYYNQTSKYISSETMFTKLMFRTELNQINKNIFSSHVLDSYKNSFVKFIQKYPELKIYSANQKIQNDYYPAFCEKNFNYKEDYTNSSPSLINVNNLQQSIQKFYINFSTEIENNIFLIYPLLCYLKFHNKKNSINSAINIAKKIIANYN